MKKFFTLIAFVATACLAVGLSSCSESNDVLPAEKQQYAYAVSITQLGGSVEEVEQVVASYFNSEVLKGIGTFRVSELNSKTIYADDKDKCDAALKKFETNHQGLDEKLAKVAGLSHATISITYNKEPVVSYSYMAANNEILGTYIYNENVDGHTYEWKLTLTNEPSQRNGYLAGSFIVPRDVDGAKAGTYDGLYSVTNTNGFTFLSYEKMEENGFSLIHVNMIVKDGTPTYTVQINSKKVIEGAVFEKK